MRNKMQTLAVPSLESVKQSGQAWNSLTKNVINCSLCHVRPILTISRTGVLYLSYHENVKKTVHPFSKKLLSDTDPPPHPYKIKKSPVCKTGILTSPKCFRLFSMPCPNYPKNVNYMRIHSFVFRNFANRQRHIPCPTSSPPHFQK